MILALRPKTKTEQEWAEIWAVSARDARLCSRVDVYPGRVEMRDALARAVPDLSGGATSYELTGGGLRVRVTRPASGRHVFTCEGSVEALKRAAHVAGIFGGSYPHGLSKGRGSASAVFQFETDGDATRGAVAALFLLPVK